MTGLVLEGGAARGAYHIGVVKAYLEAGYKFNGYAGTSVGAINAAVFAQGDFQKAEDLWRNLTTDRLFDADVTKLMELGETKWDYNLLADVSKGLKKVIDNRGIDASGIRKIIDANIDEERIRASGCDYGLVTVSIRERRPYELYLEDIPLGELTKYIVASASFPGLTPMVIGRNIFVDGALYNNCPVNMLLDKGYDEIIVVRTKAAGVFRRINAPKDVKVTVVTPEHDMGNLMMFSREKIAENIDMGYRDGVQKINA